MPAILERSINRRANLRFVPNMSEDVISFSDCRNHLADCFKRVSEPNKVLFVTQNGRPTSLLANVRDWNDFVEFCAIRDDVAAAEAELDAGLGIPHNVLKKQVAAETEEMFKELGI